MAHKPKAGESSKQSKVEPPDNGADDKAVKERENECGRAVVESGATPSYATQLYEKYLQLKALGYYTESEVNKTEADVAGQELVYADRDDERQVRLQEAELVRRFYTPTPEEFELRKSADAQLRSSITAVAETGSSTGDKRDATGCVGDAGSRAAAGMSTALEVAKGAGYTHRPGIMSRIATYMGAQETYVKSQLLAQYAGHEKARREAELQALKAMYEERRRERRNRLAALELKLRDCPEARPGEFWRVWEEFQEDKKRQEVETAAQPTTNSSKRH